MILGGSDVLEMTAFFLSVGFDRVECVLMIRFGFSVVVVMTFFTFW